ncbi:MAG: hypothetical protein HKN76_02775 [Saprospiraceae bacterium]|nr:hypothetical protein [Saprospiraceae bacterium]
MEIWIYIRELPTAGCRLIRFSALLIFTLVLAWNTFGQVKIEWDKGKAISITLPPSPLSESEWSVILTGKSTPISGKWQFTMEDVRFTPVLPFTPNLSYDVWLDGEKIESFIPAGAKGEKTSVLRIFPTTDTVPANLLKIYISFSSVMGEHFSEDFISVTNQFGDFLDNIFLPLKPELWNEHHDMLTLWLDPGRIKRELGPNKHWGNPLEEGSSYTIHLSSSWKDKNGRSLDQRYVKTIIAKKSDRVRPDISRWKILAPESSTKQTLEIEFDGPMDYILAKECLFVKRDGKEVPGITELDSSQMTWYFSAEESWAKGIYEIEVESRLEDLAGNNLNRLFDEEIKPGKQLPAEETYSRFFVIK